VLYLYNTPHTELPSHVGNPLPPVLHNNENHHFRAYYELFDPPLDVDPPLLLDDEDDDDEGAGTEELVTTEDAYGPDRETKRRELSRTRRAAGHHGRLYTCTLARFELEATSASKAASVVPDAVGVGADSATEALADEVHVVANVLAEDA
jgi:hypothetical protein